MTETPEISIGWYSYLLYEDDDIGLLACLRDEWSARGSIARRDLFSWMSSHEDLEGDSHFTEFQASARAVADRLDLTEADVTSAMNMFADRIITLRQQAEERAIGTTPAPRDLQEAKALAKIDHNNWFDLVAKAYSDYIGPDDRSEKPEVGGFRWLADLIHGIPARLQLRLALLLFPHETVRLRIYDNTAGSSHWGAHGSYATDALSLLRSHASTFSPIVVLTEGRTDAEFLSAALQVLHPHLEDLVRFLDFDYKAEGGAGALVRQVRSFAAAGIANRTVALFDNDTAAVDALRVLDPKSLPRNIRVRHYPHIDLANRYPTLGPPSHDEPNGTLSVANVNGSAGSIELYLGDEVLRSADGTLHPVQWRSFLAGTGRYQGEVIRKAEIHAAFREKVAAARRHREVIAHQDWSGMEAILTSIFTAFQEPMRIG